MVKKKKTAGQGGLRVFPRKRLAGAMGIVSQGALTFTPSQPQSTTVGTRHAQVLTIQTGQKQVDVSIIPVSTDDCTIRGLRGSESVYFVCLSNKAPSNELLTQGDVENACRGKLPDAAAGNETSLDKCLNGLLETEDSFLMATSLLPILKDRAVIKGTGLKSEGDLDDYQRVTHDGELLIRDKLSNPLARGVVLKGELSATLNKESGAERAQHNRLDEIIKVLDGLEINGSKTIHESSEDTTCKVIEFESASERVQIVVNDQGLIYVIRNGDKIEKDNFEPFVRSDIEAKDNVWFVNFANSDDRWKSRFKHLIVTPSEELEPQAKYFQRGEWSGRKDDVLTTLALYAEEKQGAFHGAIDQGPLAGLTTWERLRDALKRKAIKGLEDFSTFSKLFDAYESNTPIFNQQDDASQHWDGYSLQVNAESLQSFNDIAKQSWQETLKAEIINPSQNITWDNSYPRALTL